MSFKYTQRNQTTKVVAAVTTENVIANHKKCWSKIDHKKWRRGDHTTKNGGYLNNNNNICIKKRGWDKNHPLKLKKDWNLSFFSNSSPFTSRKIKLQLYAAYIFLNLLPSKLNPFLFLL